MGVGEFGVSVARHDLAGGLAKIWAGVDRADDARDGFLGAVLFLSGLESFYAAVGAVDGGGRAWRDRAVHGDDHVWVGDAVRESCVFETGDRAAMG